MKVINFIITANNDHFLQCSTLCLQELSFATYIPRQLQNSQGQNNSSRAIISQQQQQRRRRRPFYKSNCVKTALAFKNCRNLWQQSFPDCMPCWQKLEHSENAGIL